MAMPENRNPSVKAEPADPTRVRAFAIFFKRYMSISTIVVAALPIPVTSMGLIPTFSAQTKLLSVYASLFCFLTLGLIFYLRHQLARIMFHEHYFGTRGSQWVKFLRAGLIGLFPLLLITASIVSVFQYNDVLVLNSRKIAEKPTRIEVLESLEAGEKDRYPYGLSYTLPMLPAEEKDTNPRSFNNILKYTDLDDIPFGSRLMLLYLAIFMTAEAAFILMALKEYLQDLIKLTEWDLIMGPGKVIQAEEIEPPKDGQPIAEVLRQPELTEASPDQENVKK